MIVAATIGLSLTIFGGCTARTQAIHDDEAFPKRVIVPPCDGASARVELLDVRPDTFVHKPSLGVQHHLVELRIRARGAQELWLIVDHETFPSSVHDVTKMSDGRWSFSGGDIVFARWLGRSADVTIKDLEVRSTDRKVPVLLAQIEVEGMSPQRWVQQGGPGDHRRTVEQKLVPAGIEVVCATWFDIRGHVGSDGGS